MSFSPENFTRKLDALLETQDLIVLISQWVLFHHRHAAQLCQLWAQYVLLGQHPPRKQLSLLYLCNDVVQQARHKRKPEFAASFAPILPEVLHRVYKEVDVSTQPKIERLISVWSQRSIFDKAQIAKMSAAVAQLKEGASFAAAPAADTSSQPAGPKIAPELTHINNLLTHIALLATASAASLALIGSQLKLYLSDDPDLQDNLPLPKVYISKLNMLEKLCSMTSDNLRDSKKSRADVVAALTSLAKLISESAENDETKLSILDQRLAKIATVRDELKEMVGEDPAQEDEPEVPLPAPEPVQPSVPTPQVATHNPPSESAFNPQASSDLLPTYEASSDESENEYEPAPSTTFAATAEKRQHPAETVPERATKKQVAFSDKVQIEEFERDDHYNSMVIGGDNSDEPEAEPESEDLQNYGHQHKDAVELLHEQYGHNKESAVDPEDQKQGLLSLLLKLS